MTLHTQSGTLVASEEASTEYLALGSLPEMIHTLHQTKIKTNKAESDLSAQKALVATMTTKSNTVRLTCYFSLTSGNSYCVDESGQVYKINQEVCDRFFSGRYAEPLYSQASVPTLTTGDGDTVTPSSVSWRYRNWDGNYSDATLNQTTGEVLLYDMPGALSLLFADQPSRCSVEVYDTTNALIYQGDLTNFETLGNPAYIRMTATWEQTDRRAAYGTATYEFYVRIRDRSVITVDRYSVERGNYLTLTCTNVSDLSRLSFTATSEREDASYIGTPVFHLDGNVARALIPFPVELSGEYYDFTVSYGASAQAFSIRILPAADAPDDTIGKASNAILSATSSTERQALAQLAKDLTAAQSNLLYTDASNLPPIESGTYGYLYRSRVYSSDGLASFLSPGVEYLSASTGGESVRAISSGLVIHTGYSKYLGNFAVVEHGLGLRTWYCHMSDFDVQIGNYVTQGQSVGKTGTHTIASGNGVLLLCSVYDRFLNPAFLFSE